MTLPLRIAFVAPFGLGQKTTVWARTLPLARILASQGHKVTILIPPWDTPQDAGRRWMDGGVELINVALGGGTPLIVARLLRLIDTLQPDIVHIIKPRAHAGLVQWWLWQRRRVHKNGPRILLDIDDWEQSWSEINQYGRPLARFLAWQEEWGIRHTDGITAASRWLVERAQQYAPHTPVLYLPNGVAWTNVPVVRVQPLSTPAQILFFTRFVEVEPAWLAAFWTALQAQLPTARLLVAGEAFQPGREALYKQQLLSTKAPDQVEWLGYVDPLAVYARANCAIFPAMQLPLLQAKCSVRLATTLLHGLPVIASSVGEQAAYGANGAAWLIPADATPATFAQAVIDLLQQPAQQQKMIAQAHQHLGARYQWAVLGQQLAQFYVQFTRMSAP
ncbi:MAG: glycosyltransferase family 4 protein [Chloroflexi bacterium]|nr:glycosyltransferase family 4 protein [Chloroflexota bacterium]